MLPSGVIGLYADRYRATWPVPTTPVPMPDWRRAIADPAPGKSGLVMFVRPKDREREIWDGFRSGRGPVAVIRFRLVRLQAGEERALFVKTHEGFLDFLD